MTDVKTREELEQMPEEDLRKYKEGLKKDLREIHEKLVARHTEMKMLGMNAKARAKDEEVLRLHEVQVQRSNACQALAAFRKEKQEEARIQKEINELTLMRVEMDKARILEENKDMIAVRNIRAEERRPGGPVVWFDPLFRNIRGAEKRLIVMMAREIGQARFAELKKIAFWDEHHRNNHYYSSTMFGGKE